MKKIRNNIHGILLVDKPGLLSSNTVLQRVKHLLNATKAGHMGCLDPLATGMLPLCFGEATKFAQLGLDADKCYQVSACLGVSTSTGDAQGEVVNRVTDLSISSDKVRQLLPEFMGNILQVPPMYSALKFQGKKLYELARAGKEVPRQPRAIRIEEFTLHLFEYPHAEFEVRCSKGTYIRTLIEDLGLMLGVGAHVTQLRRLYTAGFETQRMYTLDDCESFTAEELTACLLPIDSLLKHLPILTLSDWELHQLFLGQTLTIWHPIGPGTFRLYYEQSQFKGLGQWDQNTGILKSLRLLANSTC